MKKEIIERIVSLEKQVIVNDFDEEKYINDFIQTLEHILKHKIRDRIKYEEIDYTDIDRSIIEVLTKDELDYLIDSQNLLK